MQGKLLENEQIIAKLEAKNKIFDEKVKKLKIKRDILEEAMQDMRNELYQLRGSVCKYARGEKYALVAVLMSWLIFVIVAIVRNCHAPTLAWVKRGGAVRDMDSLTYFLDLGGPISNINP